MKVGDHVSLTDMNGRRYYGKITAQEPTGLFHVKWDSGMTERVAESKLTLVPHPDFQVSNTISGPYEGDDPKSDDFHDRTSEVWDSRER